MDEQEYATTEPIEKSDCILIHASTNQDDQRVPHDRRQTTRFHLEEMLYWTAG